MIKFLAKRQLRAMSNRYHYDTGYMEDMLEQNLSAFLKFSLLNIVTTQRKGIPITPWFAARIRATLWEGCGPCVQLICNMALEAGVDPAVIAATVACDLDALNEETALVVLFTERVLQRNPDANALRERVLANWGKDGLISLAMTISTTRVYPSAKYVLGHGHACTLVQVDHHRVTPGTSQSTTIEPDALRMMPQ